MKKPGRPKYMRLSEETKQKIAQSKIGKAIPKKVRNKISNGVKKHRGEFKSPKLRVEDAIMIIGLYHSRLFSAKEIAEIYDITPQYVLKLVRRKNDEKLIGVAIENLEQNIREMLVLRKDAQRKPE